MFCAIKSLQFNGPSLNFKHFGLKKVIFLAKKSFIYLDLLVKHVDSEKHAKEGELSGNYYESLIEFNSFNSFFFILKTQFSFWQKNVTYF